MSCYPWRLAAAAGLNQDEESPVRFIIETSNWAIRWVGEHVRDEINALNPGVITTTTKPQRIANSVVHFGSQYMWLDWGRHMSRSNQYVASFFHGKREDGPDVSRHIDTFLESTSQLSKIVTGAGLIERRLLDWGVPRGKVVRIPIGVDTKMFRPADVRQRAEARNKLGFPDGALVIGSFQKDGVGWGDGMEPKLIKGPDIFLKALAKLKSETQVAVLITGPARGYVKQGLEKLGIPFVHRYVESHVDLVECYHALDLYFMTSREEGGPMGLMESMSCGVPVVSTAVGMAPDLIVDDESGALVASENYNGIAEKAMRLVSLPKEELFSLKARATVAVKVCDWSVVGRRHWDEVYSPLLKDAS